MTTCSPLFIFMFSLPFVWGACRNGDETSFDSGRSNAGTSPSVGEAISSKDSTGSYPVATDLDGDGYSVAEGDCDDGDPSAHPDAPEWLLTNDKNCDGQVGDNLSLADYRFYGANGGDHAGCSVSSAGDIDADGRDDILIGACGADDSGLLAGKAHLVLGRNLGDASTINLADADYSFIGERKRDMAGVSVSGAGDVDGDGFDDILIGADQNDDGGEDYGKAYLVLSSSLSDFSTIDLADADYRLYGENGGDHAGCSVSSAGDVDADGRDDILIGAYGNDNGGSFAGKAYLLLGQNLDSISPINLAGANYSFIGENESDLAGISVSGTGDVDGDGFDDILIGANSSDDGGEDAGKAYLVLSGSLSDFSTIDLADADYSFVGEASEDYAGRSVSSAGDVDGDGLDDLLIGAYGNDEGGDSAGKSYLILSSSLGGTSSIDLADVDYRFVGEDSGDRSGNSVSSAGDVNNDGVGDILIGSTNYHSYDDSTGSYIGMVYLLMSHL